MTNEREREREEWLRAFYLLLGELMDGGISLLKGKDLLLFPTLNSAISVYIKVRIYTRDFKDIRYPKRILLRDC